MDSAEWHVWSADLGRKFPAIRDWVRGITPEADYVALIDSWEAAMVDLPLDDCLKVNRLMLSGELDGPGDWPAQWQGLPARIRRHVKTIRDADSGPLPMSDAEQVEHERILLVRNRRKHGIAAEAIDAELRSQGYDGIVIPSRDLKPSLN